MPPNRVWRPFHVLEEHKHGMWRRLNGDARQPFIDASAALMSDPEAFEAAMLRAISEWPESCAAALTVGAMNRRAWMGHAGCCIATGSPEELTRLGWHTLTPEQQAAANAAADRAIAVWEASHVTPGEPMRMFSDEAA